MRKRLVYSVACAAVMAGILALSVEMSAAGKPGTYSTISTIADTDVVDFRVTSDGKGDYGSTIGRYSPTSSDWTLETSWTKGAKATGRSVLYDFSEPVSNTNPPPPFTDDHTPGLLAARCHVDNLDMITIPVGQSILCPGAFNFDTPDGRSYRFTFQPANFPEVNKMKITCIGAWDSVGCKRWSITPSGTITTGGDPHPKNVNKLVEVVKGSDIILADLGDYYLSFYITVAR